MTEERREEIGCPWEEDEDICDPENFGERICTFPKKKNIKEFHDGEYYTLILIKCQSTFKGNY